MYNFIYNIHNVAREFCVQCTECSTECVTSDIKCHSPLDTARSPPLELVCCYMTPPEVQHVAVSSEEWN